MIGRAQVMRKDGVMIRHARKGQSEACLSLAVEAALLS